MKIRCLAILLLGLVIPGRESSAQPTYGLGLGSELPTGQEPLSTGFPSDSAAARQGVWPKEETGIVRIGHAVSPEFGRGLPSPDSIRNADFSPAWDSGTIQRTQYPLTREPVSQPIPPESTPLPVTPTEPPERWLSIDRTSLETTWLPGGSEPDSFGFLTFDVRGKLVFPRLPMLAITPRFGAHLLDGPLVTDMPGHLYDTSLETVVSLPLGESLFVQGAVAPSLFSDGENRSSDAFRIPSRLLFFYNHTETLTLSAGLFYLDREDINFIPAAGLIYKPSDRFRVELMVPRPKVAWQYASDLASERWVYIVGEFGGNSWAVRRASGLDDIVSYRDYRALLGWELKNEQGPDIWLEAGYVFSRELEYVSTGTATDLAETALLRIGLAY